MNFKYPLTNKIETLLKDSKLTEIKIGMSGSQVIKIESYNQIYYLKMDKIGKLTKEYEKLKWLQDKLPNLVSKIIIYDKNNEYEYLITKSVEGEMLCSDNIEKNKSIGIKILAEAVNKMSEVDITDCPFYENLDNLLKQIKDKIDRHQIDILNIDKSIINKYQSINNIYNYLIENKPKEELSFSYGDISMPNVFAKDNHLSGLIDVGECGIKDKYVDITVATKTIIRNYGIEYLEEFYNHLGIIPDKNKIEYYTLLIELL